MKVSDLMTREVVTVERETSLRDAARILEKKGISGVPVVEGGSVVGVLSEADIVVKAGGASHGNKLLGWLLEADLGLEDKIRAHTVGDAMSAPAITIRPDRPIHEAAKLMAAEGVNRLPVVDETQLVGIVTRADVVRAFTRSDAEIADEIENEILRRTLWLEPGTVTLEVVDGEVTLEGEVETDADAELLPVFVSRVPGVIAVRANVRSRARAALSK
ncbi:MAG TPA: CBS domain-containing protein [Gaiellaceae bacterium]|nr:CBS domain-containing protein [Gaiellaceae bacterium]